LITVVSIIIRTSKKSCLKVMRQYVLMKCGDSNIYTYVNTSKSKSVDLIHEAYTHGMQGDNCNQWKLL